MRQRSTSQSGESHTSLLSSKSLSGDSQVTSQMAKTRVQSQSLSCQLSMESSRSWEATTRKTEAKMMMMHLATQAIETISAWWWIWLRTNPSQTWTMRVPRIDAMSQWLSCLAVMISAMASQAQDRVAQARCPSVTEEAKEVKLRISTELRRTVRSTWLRLTIQPSHTTRLSFAPTKRSSSSTSQSRSAMKSVPAPRESRKHPDNWTRWWQNSWKPFDPITSTREFKATLNCGVHNLDNLHRSLRKPFLPNSDILNHPRSTFLPLTIQQST